MPAPTPTSEREILAGLVERVTVDWSSAPTLMRNTSIPTDALHAIPPDHPEFAFLGRVLRYLKWFGLIEQRPEGRLYELEVEAEYRKTPLYDRFISFELDDKLFEGTLH